MKELEDTHCEVRRIIEIHSSIWDGLNTSGGDEFGHSAGSPTFKGSEIPCGGFLEDANYAWLGNGPRFVVINAKSGENIASWTFRDKVTCVAQFPTQPGEVSLLLVGLDNGAIKAKDSAGMLCIFDCSTSRVVRAIRMPAGVEQVCVMNGGAEWEDFNEKRTHGILSESSGIACVVLRNLYHIVMDLRRSLWEGDMSSFNTNELSPTDIEFSENKYSSSARQHSDRGRHLAYNLLNTGIEEFIRFNREEFEMAPLYDENLTTALIHSKKLGCLISGCLGRIIIWQNDGSVGWISAPAKNNMAISHLALLEPTDDPRPFYYLWVAYQEESFETAPILRMYALLIERKYRDTETDMHFKIEGEPSLKFELQLEAVDRVTSLMSIEKTINHEQNETNNKKGEESLLLIGISGKTLLFDLNQWYKEQMPRNIRECPNPNIFLSRYQMKSETFNVSDDVILSCAYLPSTLREFPSNGGNSLEELFYPKSLCFSWVELTTNRLRIWMTRGLQWELLREMAVAGPSILIQPSETFHRCLAAGLVPFNTDCSFDCDQNTQREMLLSLCLEQRWAPFLIRCAKEWVDGSVSYLFPMFLRWGAQRASSLKIIADQLCIPLFDQSGSTIGDTEIKLLRFCSQQLECLSNVVARLPIESDDLIKQQRALRRVATHLGVLLWFYDVGLLPETHEINEETLPITFSLQIPYPYERLAAIYQNKREKIKRNTTNSGDSKEELFIDELMTQECQALRSQWEREGGNIGTEGYYPPPSLQSLLRSYLLDCHQNGSDEMGNKHQITIYLLMDLVKLLQGSCPDVDQLIKYPSAFKMSPSLIKLTQAFWLLDHEDYQGFLDTLTGQLVSDSDVKDWHHKLVIRTLMRNNEYKLALTYLRVRKPPLSAIGDQSTSISLSVECGLVQTAFHQRPPSHYRQLLSAFFQACKSCGKLHEILQLALDPEEEEAFVQFLEENKSEETRLLYYLQRCRYTEAGSANLFSCSKPHLKNIQSAPMTMVNAYNATLPQVTKDLSTNLSKKHSESVTEGRYPRPMSHKRSYNKSQGVFEAVLKKVRETYVRGDSCQIPFISAPCTSLRLNSSKNNSSCVLFPILAPKAVGKRTLDQMREDEAPQQHSEENKRRKLSGDSDELDKSGMRKLGASVAFETPLIQRKRPMSDRIQQETETPHSILKIRQLIQSSTSPRTLARRPINEQNNDSSKHERKPSRQIRFSIGQPSNDSSHEEMGVNASNDTDKGNASEESEEAFYSPNASGKSQSTDSNYSISSIRGPRPRPSLRQSGTLSSSESPIESRDSLNKKELRATLLKYSLNERSTLAATPVRPSSKSVLESLKGTKESDSVPMRCSLSPITSYSASNESKYSSRVLPSDCSFLSTPGVTFDKGDDVSKSHVRVESPSDERSDQQEYLPRSETSNIYSEVKDYKHGLERKKLVSTETSRSTTFTRSILTRTTITEQISDRIEDEEVVVEVDDFGLDHEPEVCFADAKQTEQCHVGNDGNNGEESDEENGLEGHNDQDKEGPITTWRIETEEQHQSDAEKAEDQNSVSSSQRNRELETSDDENNQPEEVDDNTDDYEAELLVLKDKEEEENEECFQSLTNSAASGIETLPALELENIAAARVLPRLSRQCIAENSNITEDESSNDVTEEYQKIAEKPQSEITTQELPASYEQGTEALASYVQTKDMTESNFTEDESVSSSIEHFELIADDSEMEEDTNQDSTQKNEYTKLGTTDNKSHALRENDPADQIYVSYSNKIAANPENSQLALSPVIENTEADLKELEHINESAQSEVAPRASHEIAILHSETDSAVSTVSATDIPSPSHKKGKTSANRSRQQSKSPTPVRMTRARRASSATKEVSGPSGAESCLKESNTDAIECPESSVSLIDIAHTILSESNSRTQTVRLKKANRRSASVDKDVSSSSINMEDVQTSKAEVSLRRSSRRAASAQREMPTIPEISHEKVKDSKLSSIAETDSIKESESASKKPQRIRKPSFTSQDSDVILPGRTRRSTSIAKESEAEGQNTSKVMTKKRSISVPKEMDTSRTKRASSLAKDVINEETTKSPIGVKRPKSATLTQDIGQSAVNSPAKNTRSRRLFVQTIPEEEDLILSTRIRERSSSNASSQSEKVAKQGKARERRAVSLEPSKSEVKKRTRSTLAQSIVTEETIEEETTEDGAEGKTKQPKKINSRKRTVSTTSNSEEKNPEKVSGGRKTSRSKSKDSVFLFSLPEATSDPPSNQQDIEPVPPYVFSPPHTRSRHPAISQLPNTSYHH